MVKTVLEEVAQERTKQDAKWGQQNHPMGTGNPGAAVLANRARDLCDDMFKQNKGNWTHIITEEFFEAMAEPPGPKLREELIQLAAVAVAMVECLDRKGTTHEQ